MAVGTLDGALAGFRPPQMIAKAVTPTLVAGRPASLWALGGRPGAGAFDNTLNGVVLSSSSVIPAGAIPHYDPASGNSYLGRFQAAATQAGVLLLLDRLWHNGGITITSTGSQGITSPAWPARCPTSGSNDAPSVNGEGVMAFLEVSAATGAGTPTLTVGYTNQAGTSGRTATNMINTVASSAIGACYPIGLQAGDTGIRSVQSYQQSATWTSGTVNLVCARLLAALELPGNLVPNAIDALTSGMPRMYDGVVPWLVFVPSATTASVVTGSLVETQG